MGQRGSKPDPAVSRINLLGHDIVTIEGVEAVRKAIDSGDLCRLKEASPTLIGLPLLFRLYLPVARFFTNLGGGFFLNMTGENDARYPPCRAFLDKHFSPGSYDISPFVNDAVDVLVNEKENRKSDKKLQDIFIHALLDRFFVGDRIPDRIISHASKAIVDIPQTLNPVRYIRARFSVPKLFRYVRDNFKNKESVEEGSTVDVGHGTIASHIHGLPSLRECAKNPAQESAPQVFARLGRIERLPRMTLVDSTLGGLLTKDNPVKAKKTLVMLKIDDISIATGDHSWAFGEGSTHRRCAAEPAILEFVQAVQNELVKRQSKKD